MRKLRRCPAQDQCSKSADFCHFGLFWQNPGYRTKIHKFDIPAKCSTFYECTFFQYFFSDMLRKKGSFFTKKVTFTPKKKHFFHLYLQRALNEVNSHWSENLVPSPNKKDLIFQHVKGPGMHLYVQQPNGGKNMCVVQKQNANQTSITS